MKCFIDGAVMQHLAEDLHLCPVCSLISSDIKPDLSLYDKSYVTKYLRYEHSDINVPLQKYRLDAVARECRTRLPILDYGCGSGAFVRYAESRGVPAMGFDINPFSEFCNPAAILGEYAVLTMWDVIEHIKDPTPLLKGIKHDILGVSTPCVGSWPGDIADLTHWKHYYPGEHVHYFSEEALTSLFETSGYKVQSLTYGESEYRPGCGGKNIMTMVGVKNG